MILGFSHMQLVVTDVAVSARWYCEVLGLEQFVAGAMPNGGAFAGLNAQKLRPASMLMPICFFGPPVAPRGSGAPMFTHFSKSAITASGSLPFGGICTSPAP